MPIETDKGIVLTKSNSVGNRKSKIHQPDPIVENSERLSEQSQLSLGSKDDAKIEAAGAILILSSKKENATKGMVFNQQIPTDDNDEQDEEAHRIGGDKQHPISCTDSVFSD